MRAATGAALGIALLAACSPSEGPAARRAALDLRAREVRTRAAAADSAARAGQRRDDPIALWIMPYHYAEISALTLTADGRLYGLGDENSEIWQIDYLRGVVLGHFTVGDPPIQADFEGMVAVDSALYLMDSKGRIYRTVIGANGATVPYDEFDSALGKECEFEGLSWDPASSMLLLGCKHVGKGAPRDALVIYRVSPGGRGAAGAPIVIPQAALAAAGGQWHEFSVSELTRDPRTGNFLVMAALQRALVEITPSGQVVKAGAIPGHHRQPEGAAITPDGRLIVADEAAGDRPIISVYPSTGI